MLLLEGKGQARPHLRRGGVVSSPGGGQVLLGGGGQVPPPTAFGGRGMRCLWGGVGNARREGQTPLGGGSGLPRGTPSGGGVGTSLGRRGRGAWTSLTLTGKHRLRGRSRILLGWRCRRCPGGRGPLGPTCRGSGVHSLGARRSHPGWPSPTSGGRPGRCHS
ncbi:hypothetical protein NE237_012220 [Protea cynaroides]|uniref:Uncharacterized protein n=1 Tax=Protea cynaroides TaxID=273540 RepID=A0A9Q0H0N1_9MAGN|nr:hypothetical protein NE237_012220 [Protea cynaroides]